MTNPTCPHCQYEFDEDESWNHKGANTVNADDGDISDLDCPQCKAKFHVVCHHDINWKPCNEHGDIC